MTQVKQQHLLLLGLNLWKIPLDAQLSWEETLSNCFTLTFSIQILILQHSTILHSSFFVLPVCRQSPTNSLPTAAISCPYWSCSFLHCPVLIPLSRGNPDAWIAMFFPGSLQWKTSLNTYWALSHSPAWLLLPSRHPPTASALPPLTSNLQSLICFVNSLFLEFMALENSTSGLSFR